MTENFKMDEVISDGSVTRHVEESTDNDNDALSSSEFSEQGQLVVSRDWTANYIIVENIINGLGWRDQMMCLQVCRLWNEIVTNLRRKNLGCYDYTLVKNGSDNQIFMDVSKSPVTAKPLICFSFALNFSSASCADLSPPPCKKPCKKHHCLSDSIEANLLCKGAHHISVSGFPKIYEPLSTSNTYQYTVHSTMKTIIGGLHLPQIPGVNVNILQYRRKSLAKRDIYFKVDDICHSDVIKGVIVFVEERMLLIDNEKLEFIKYLKTVQNDEPFALGGCVVGSVSSYTEGMENNSQCSVTAIMVIFSVRRRQPRPNFEMHSLLLHPSCFYKAMMKEDVKNFAEQVPKTEFSACLKLSCIGRDSMHAKELGVFREAFPRTTVVGCFGNGEIGYDHPKKYMTRNTKSATKFCITNYDNYSFTYCTVFVLFSWGKVLVPGKPIELDNDGQN